MAKPLNFRPFVWAVFAIQWFLVCAIVSWHLWAAVDFGYPLWYRVLDIDQTIQSYAPKNLVKTDFQLTSESERKRLFAAIVSAVQNHGHGLADIEYYDRDGQRIDSLLTEAEQTHLIDVARLVAGLNRAAVVLLVLCVGGLFLVYRKRLSMPSEWRLLSSTGMVIGVLGLFVILLGPTRVFYWLHEQIFPAGHQWFFYYEESLMSLMMKAPVLFGPIAIMILGLAIIFFMVSILLLRRFAKRIVQWRSCTGATS